jgi:hypothetical protein
MQFIKSERDYISKREKRNMKERRYHITYCHGQTDIFVPIEAETIIGKEKLEELVKSFFEWASPRSVDSSTIYYAHDCVFLELPTVINPEGEYSKLVYDDSEEARKLLQNSRIRKKIFPHMSVPRDLVKEILRRIDEQK